MAGASSAYSGFHLIAKRDIQKGDELFVDRTRNARLAHPLYSTQLPLAEDYELVDDMVRAIADGGGLVKSLTEAQFQDMLHRLANEVLVQGHPLRGSIIVQQSLFPRTKREFEHCLQVGAAKFRLVERSLEWIETNGESS
jgi:hypothetical protein